MNGGLAYSDGVAIDASGNLTPIAAPDASVLNPPERWYSVGWTAGGKMWTWGGSTGDASDITNTGASYDPVAKTWAAMPTPGALSARVSSAAVWTGTEEVVWGGWDAQGKNGTYFNDGALFTP